MAAYSFGAKIITRGTKNGRRPGNVVFSAAYNARSRFTDDRTGESRDYRGKGAIEWSGIFLPKRAPKWMKDRESLWNAVESREDDHNHAETAQLARSWIIAIPHELNERQRRFLITDFAREISRTGVVVDVCIHPPDSDEQSDPRNYHAHLLLTLREITPNGFGNKVRAWNGRAQIERWRDRWAELAAKALGRAGHHREGSRFRHGHRKLAVQYRESVNRRDHEHAEYLRDRIPTIHLGPHVKAMENKRGLYTEKGDRFRAIQAENIRRERRKASKHRLGPIGQSTALVAQTKPRMEFPRRAPAEKTTPAERKPDRDH